MEAFIATFIKWPLRVRFRRKSYLRFIPVAEISHWNTTGTKLMAQTRPILLALKWSRSLSRLFSTGLLLQEPDLKLDIKQQCNNL